MSAPTKILLAAERFSSALSSQAAGEVRAQNYAPGTPAPFKGECGV